MVVAARTDAQLKPKVAALTARFSDNISRTFRELFPHPPDAAPYWDLMPVLTFAFLQGLALDTLAASDRSKVDRALQIWRQLARLMMSGANGRPHAI